MSAPTTVEAVRIQRVFPIRIQPQSPESLSGDAANSRQTPSLDASPAEGEDAAEPIQPSPALARHDSQPEDDHATNGATQVSTSEHLGMVSPEGGRFISNTFSYHGGDKLANKCTSRADQKIYRCEDEPIHIPGAIQRFGALIAIRENEFGQFLVRVVSENVKSVTGVEPEVLFEIRCFTDLLIRSDKKEFATRVRGMQHQGNTARANLDVFSLSLTSLMGAPLECFIAMHWNAESNLVICEFELKKDVFNPRHPPEDGLPDEPVNVIEGEASEEDRLRSKTSQSKPLHAVQVAREVSRQIGSMELFHVLCEIQTQLAAATVLPELLDIIVGLVYELTSFHRVMVYQFDETAAGSIVSEIVNPKASSDIYRGLKFPSTDIPKQARDLYMINKIRVLYDRDQPVARLVCRTKEDAVIPLDLKHSYLRAMSPIHIKYLENMGVRASMSISLTVDNKLWGLISCHGYGSGMRVSLPVRELCRALGDLASTCIEKLMYATRIKARKPLTNAPPKNSPSAYIASSSSDLLNIFGADFGFLAIKGEARTIGKLFAYNEAIVLLQYIRQKNITSIFSSHNLTKDCKDIPYAPGFEAISGMLVIPLTLSSSDFLVFFRKTQAMEVQWAGNPYEKKRAVGAYLQPRASFRRWSEHVVGRSRKWTEDQVESAAVLSTLYGRFIEVWRQKEAIVQKNRMTRLLIRNAGHEVRTPLNSIINYLEVALEEELDGRVRQHLQKSLQASKSLVFQVNDLLNLTEAEVSDFNTHEDNVDLRDMAVEVIASFKEGSMGKNLNISLTDDGNVPRFVRCDPSMLRQVMSNLLANSIQHSVGGIISVKLEHVSTTKSNVLVEMSVQDDGRGMSESELDVLFQDFEQVLDDENHAFGLYNDNGKSHLEPITPDPSQGLEQVLEETNDISSPQDEDLGTTQSVPVSLGLGLAMAARFVRLNCGQISIASEKGKGTTVTMNIPFRKARPDFTHNVDSQNETSLLTPPILTLDGGIGSTGLSPTAPGILERSLSADTILPVRHQRGSSLGSGPEALVSVANAVVFTNTPTYDPATGRYPFLPVGLAYHKVNVLVAEDNPLNSHLLETRLTRSGHVVKVTTNGQACAETFKNDPDTYDVILMDIQMPLVDGVASARLIRAFEKENSPPCSQKAQSYGRIPIIAVSASLSEQARSDYIDYGFDGWILKPIDFTRLEAILAAIENEQIRSALLYENGCWDMGGWFKLKWVGCIAKNVERPTSTTGTVALEGE